ncbi:MAG: DUF4296 domain-containing protein [Bacteroidales bacterium]|nr:DUF4296 domain-containing protein [Bacteroidales bacterium]
MTYFKTLTIIIFFSVSFFACNQNDKSNELIPKKTFINLLIDLHKVDALLNNMGLMDNKLTNEDSLSYYNKIFQDYDITRAQFYYTFDYYTHNMSDFLELQKIVIDSLNNEFILLDSLAKIGLRQQDLWTLKREWSLPKDGVTNSIPFKFATKNPGNYTLTADIKSYPDDLSKELEMKIGAYYSDASEDVNAVKIDVKNGTWKQYSVKVSVNPNKQLSYIEVELLSHSNNTTYMHVQVKGVMLTFEELDNALDSVATN